MVYEGLRQEGSMIIVPSSAVETMGLGALGGLTAFDRIPDLHLRRTSKINTTVTLRTNLPIDE